MIRKKENLTWKMVAGAALCGALYTGTAIAQDDPVIVKDDGTVRVPDIPATKPNATPKHSPTPDMHMKVPPGSDERADMVQQNGRFLVDTLSEEKTEINTLAAQVAAFRKMGGSENIRIANLLERMRKEHVAASPALEKLARRYGGILTMAKIMKPPVVGSKAQMLHATHMDHMKAVQTSQMRHKMSNSAAVRNLMHKRANMARKHIRWMKPYHDRAMKAANMNRSQMGGVTHDMKP